MHIIGSERNKKHTITRESLLFDFRNTLKNSFTFLQKTNTLHVQRWSWIKRIRCTKNWRFGNLCFDFITIHYKAHQIWLANLDYRPQSALKENVLHYNHVTKILSFTNIYKVMFLVVDSSYNILNPYTRESATRMPQCNLGEPLMSYIKNGFPFPVRISIDYPPWLKAIQSLLLFS